MRSELKNNKYVYHYTSIDTLFAILHNYRKEEKDSLKFHASNIFKVNDPMEMEAGYNALKTFLPQYEKENRIKNGLSKIFQNEIYEKKCREDFLRRGEMIDIGTIPYIVSFSARRDYLPMWSLYGKKGKGVCLKFNVYDMINNIFSPCQKGFVSYGKSFSKDLKENVFPEIYYYSIKELNEKNMSPNDKISELATLALSVAPFQKYADYAYEREFRIVHYCYYGTDEKLKNVNTIYPPKTRVEPYVEIQISSKTLKDVIIGPSADFDVMKPIIDKELCNCGINVKSHKSKVPFRL